LIDQTIVEGVIALCDLEFLFFRWKLLDISQKIKDIFLASKITFYQLVIQLFFLIADRQK
jgi:hypothetical protein